MANRKYIVIGPYMAYGVQTGDPQGVMLDADNPLVQANVDAGIIALAPDQPKTVMTACPACIGQNLMKRPPTFSTMVELIAHYNEKHPALVIPTRLEGE